MTAQSDKKSLFYPFQQLYTVVLKRQDQAPQVECFAALTLHTQRYNVKIKKDKYFIISN